MNHVIPKIPVQFEYQQVKEIGPSTFTALKNGCLLQYVLQRAAGDVQKETGYSLLLPSYAKTILGTIVHKLLEYRTKGLISSKEVFEHMWKDQINQKQSYILEIYPVLRDFTLCDYYLMYQTRDLAFSPIITPLTALNSGMRNNSGVEPTVMAEKGYIIPNYLKGTIDKVNIIDDEAEIIDYKSAQVLDSDTHKIKTEYIDQLNLYALLFEENNSDKHVTSLKIIDIKGEEFCLPLDPNRKCKLDEVKTIIDDINNSINHNQIDQLCKLSEKCNYCNCRHLCKSYWNSSVKSSDFQKGKVSEVGKDYIKLTTASGIITVRGLKKLNVDHSEFYLGRNLLFANLSPNDNYIEQYQIQGFTLVFEYSDSNSQLDIFYQNYIDDVHPFVREALAKGLHLSEDGSYVCVDDQGVVVAEAYLGLDSPKVVVHPLDDISEAYFIRQGYTVLRTDQLEQFKIMI